MPEPVESVTIDEELRDLVAQQAARRGMESVEDYVDFLIRLDLLQNRREEIEAKLLDALNSGEPIEVTPEFWEERRRRLKKTAAEKGTP
jgi:antitoxin ParD1/3/4